MSSLALTLVWVWFLSFVTYILGDLKICDWEEGCGPSWPEWLFYASDGLAFASFTALTCVGVASLVQRLHRRR